MNAKITEFGHELMFTEFPLRRFSRAMQGEGMRFLFSRSW